MKRTWYYRDNQNKLFLYLYHYTIRTIMKIITMVIVSITITIIENHILEKVVYFSCTPQKISPSVFLFLSYLFRLIPEAK